MSGHAPNGHTPGHGLDLVPLRALVEETIDVRFALSPGDRVIAEEGSAVTVGAPLAERFRDTILAATTVPEGEDARPGERWTPTEAPVRRGPSRRPARRTSGELLFPWRDGWRVASGSMRPAQGAGRRDRSRGPARRRDRRPGRGTCTAGHRRARRPDAWTPQAGRRAERELRPGGLDVGLASTILVVGARVDAETLTRARAMGVRGIVVAGLPSKERRDWIASEARQKAALHRLPPFAVLVLDGAVRRSIAGPVVGLLEALEGHEVAIVNDPGARLRRAGQRRRRSAARSRPRPQRSRAGHEGRWVASLGPRRFAHGVQLEAAQVRFAEGLAVVPVGNSSGSASSRRAQNRRHASRAGSRRWVRWYRHGHRPPVEPRAGRRGRARRAPPRLRHGAAQELGLSSALRR